MVLFFCRRLSVQNKKALVLQQQLIANRVRYYLKLMRCQHTVLNNSGIRTIFFLVIVIPDIKTVQLHAHNNNK
jgi:hypothetical protein